MKMFSSAIQGGEKKKNKELNHTLYESHCVQRPSTIVLVTKNEDNQRLPATSTTRPNICRHNGRRCINTIYMRI